MKHRHLGTEYFSWHLSVRDSPPAIEASDSEFSRAFPVALNQLTACGTILQVYDSKQLIFFNNVKKRKSFASL